MRAKAVATPLKILKPVRRKEVTMINVVKIQNDCIKKLVKGGRVDWCKFENEIWVTTDCYSCYGIPNEMFFVDLSTKSPMNALSQLRENFAAAEGVIATNDMNYPSNSIKFINAAGDEHWLEEKFVKICHSWLFYKHVFYGLQNGKPVLMVMEINPKRK